MTAKDKHQWLLDNGWTYNYEHGYHAWWSAMELVAYELTRDQAATAAWRNLTAGVAFDNERLLDTWTRRP